MSTLCEGVTVAPPAAHDMDAFFSEPSHIIARIMRDVLTTGDVAETLLNIIPAIVQARKPGGRPSAPTVS